MDRSRKHDAGLHHVKSCMQHFNAQFTLRLLYAIVEAHGHGSTFVAVSIQSMTECYS